MDKGIEALKPGKYAILYRDNWDGEGDTYHALANLEPDGRWLSDETGKELHEYEGDEILKAWPLDDNADTLALIAALEQAQQENKSQLATLTNTVELWNEQRTRVAELEKTLRGTEESLIAAVDQVAELESAPNAMMQLSNELAEMKRKRVELTVWYGAMPESNGKTNWTAILHRKGEGRLDGMTIDRSEYPGRVLYAADRVRYLIGEKAERPHILDYDADKHSGYTARKEGE